jgi:hypothetical protein
MNTTDNLKSSELYCIVDFAFSEPLECYCLVIADWRFEDSLKGYFGRSFSNRVANKSARNSN